MLPAPEISIDSPLSHKSRLQQHSPVHKMPLGKNSKGAKKVSRIRKRPGGKKAAGTSGRPARGGREALTTDQLVAFYKALLAHGPAWTAVLFVMQLMLGDRADCSRQISTSWLDLSSPKPCVTIPKVNGKTVPRKIPLHSEFVKQLLSLMTGSPLQGAKGCWPFTGQGLVDAENKMIPDVLLFPGRVRGGHDERNWKSPISERAYQENLVQTSKALTAERSQAHLSGASHVFDDVEMSRIGTHSLKKSAVTVMRDDNISAKIVGAVTGTGTKLIDSVYYQATMHKCREAVQNAYTPVLAGVCARQVDGNRSNTEACPKCKLEKKDQAWVYCPMCGVEFARPP